MHDPGEWGKIARPIAGRRRPRSFPSVPVMLLVLLFALPSGGLAIGHSLGSAPAAPAVAASGIRPEVRPPGLVPGPIRDYHFETTQLPAASGVPVWLAYDPGVRSFYVAESNGSVAVIPSGTQNVAASIPVGASPFGVAYDPADGRVFVTNSGSDNVSVISDATNRTIASVPVGGAPYGVAYDPTSGAVLVANGGWDSVTIFDARTLLPRANISVGMGPIGIVYDAADREAFVANAASASVSVISTTTDTVVATVGVPTGPYGLALDNQTDEVYVSESQAGLVSVINASRASVVATVAVEGTPQGIAFDWQNRTVWVADSRIMVIVINATDHRILQQLLFDPLGAAYDPDTNSICVTNSANSTFQCLVPGRYYSYQTFLNVTETGLKPGTLWTLSVNNGYDWRVPGSQLNSTGSTIDFQMSAAFGFSYSVVPVSGYSANPATGSVGGYLRWYNLTIAFGPAPGHYVARFVEHGLRFDPFSVLLWGVQLVGVDYLSNIGVTVVDVTNGTYGYTADPVPGYLPPPIGAFVVLGADREVDVNYSGSVYSIEFDEHGLPGGWSWNVTLGGVLASAYAPGSIAFSQPNGTFAFTIGGVPGFSAVPSVPFVVVVQGANTSVVVTFSRSPSPERFPVTFGELGLPTGSAWSVVLNGSYQASANTTIVFFEPNGSFPFTILPVRGYSAAPSSALVTVNGVGVTENVQFTLVPPGNYPITFSETGLPDGTLWSVAFGSGTWSSITPYITVSTPNGTYRFLVGSQSGYSATPASGSVSVNGVGIQQSIAFAPGPPTGLFGLPASDGWYALSGVIAVVIIVVAALAYVVGRRRAGPGSGPGPLGPSSGGAPRGPPPG